MQKRHNIRTIAIDSSILASLPILVVLPSFFTRMEYAKGLASDATLFHIPQIDFFIRHPFNMLDYLALAPTLPGYHIAMAWLAIVLNYQDAHSAAYAFRAVHLLIALCLAVITIYASLNRDSRDFASGFLSPIVPLLPLFCSWYFIQALVYPGTDHPSLFLVALVLVLIKSRARGLVIGVASAALIFVKQVFLPIVLVPAVRALLFEKRTIRDLALMVMPATALAAVYFLSWGGAIVPPGIARSLNDTGFHIHSLIHAVAFIGFSSIIFAPLTFSANDVALFWQTHRRLIVIVFTICCIVWLSVPTNYDVQAGRWASIIWAISQYTPAPLSRSISTLLLFVLGSQFLVLLFTNRSIGAKTPEVLVLLFYCLAISFTAAAYQRYIEPVAFLTLGSLCANRLQAGKLPIMYSPLLLYCSAGIGLSIFRLYFAAA